MSETFNSIIKNESIEKFDRSQGLWNKNFSNEVIGFSDVLNLLEIKFGCLTFLNCEFINIDFSYSQFFCCEFYNCSFTNLIFFKSEFTRCSFINSNVVNSDFRKADFSESHFIECQFTNINMALSYFIDCEFFKPKFNKIDTLNRATVTNSKIWNSSNFIQVHSTDDLEKIFNELED